MDFTLASRGYSKLQKPDKIYLNNTNLMKAITHKSDTGNERETFFVNQIKSYFLNSDEISGKNKTKKQLMI